MESESALPQRSRRSFPHDCLARNRALLRLFGWKCPMTSLTEIQQSAADPRLRALLETARSWTLEQGLILAEVECVLCLASRLLHMYRGRLTAERLPASLRTPYELMAWARPERAENDVTGLEQSAHWIARWLVLCLPGDQDLQGAACSVILVQARSQAERFVY